MKVGDSLQVRGYPADVPLRVYAIVSGRVAILSPEWPKGATRLVEFGEIITVNGVRVQTAAKPSTAKHRGRRSA
ncbi:MAG: hypothetical protein RLZZ511_4142 [Cyanobacteriota bacterium]|jgi:hypothetical protein